MFEIAEMRKLNRFKYKLELIWIGVGIALGLIYGTFWILFMKLIIEK
jgi:hypothetical protein